LGSGGQDFQVPPNIQRLLEATQMFEGIFQPMHLVVILIIALLFFGPSKLAGLGKGLGDGIRGFKDALKEVGPSDDSEKK
jgi:sec-independent protein translocase protein TatA